MNTSNQNQKTEDKQQGTETPMPNFLDDDGPAQVPVYITKTTSVQEFDLMPGETVQDAIMRKSKG